MKTLKIFSIGNLLLPVLLMFLVLPFHAEAQQTKETKKERKEREKLEKLEKFRQARKLLLDSVFIIPVQSVRLSSGEIIHGIDGTKDFLKVVGENIVLQVATGYYGHNGLGGSTLVGKMTELKISDNEKENKFFMTFILFGNPKVRLSISLYQSDLANVDVDPMQYEKMFSLVGPVKHPDEVDTLEGTPF
jgi:hypothetical protein